MAIKPLRMLCSPTIFQCTSATFSPLWNTANSVQSWVMRSAYHSWSLPTYWHSDQQPMARVCSTLCSPAKDKMRPLFGIVRIIWWNWRWMAFKSSKISAWSKPMLLIIKRAWVVMYEFWTLIEKMRCHIHPLQWRNTDFSLNVQKCRNSLRYRRLRNPVLSHFVLKSKWAYR